MYPILFRAKLKWLLNFIIYSPILLWGVHEPVSSLENDFLLGRFFLYFFDPCGFNGLLNGVTDASKKVIFSYLPGPYPPPPHPLLIFCGFPKVRTQNKNKRLPISSLKHVDIEIKKRGGGIKKTEKMLI